MTIYDCHHKFRTVKCLFLTVESESPQFVCVRVCACDHVSTLIPCSELCYGRGSHCYDTRLCMLATMLTEQANLAI